PEATPARSVPGPMSARLVTVNVLGTLRSSSGSRRGTKSRRGGAAPRAEGEGPGRPPRSHEGTALVPTSRGAGGSRGGGEASAGPRTPAAPDDAGHRPPPCRRPVQRELPLPLPLVACSRAAGVPSLHQWPGRGPRTIVGIER